MERQNSSTELMLHPHIEEVPKPLEQPKEPLERGQYVASCGFGNSVSIPLALLEGLYPAAMFQEELRLSVSYAAIYIAVSQICLYTWGQALCAGTEALLCRMQRIQDPPGECGKAAGWKRRLWKTFSLVLTPPTISLVLGLTVALIEPVQRLFYHLPETPVLFPDYPAISPPLVFFSSAIEQLAGACEPHPENLKVSLTRYFFFTRKPLQSCCSSWEEVCQKVLERILRCGTYSHP